MTARPSSHAVVLLAAGRSTRLGQSKQLLRRSGETLLQRAARLALATTPATLIVVLADDRGPVAQALHGLPHQRVVNADPAQGLASSLRAAAAPAAGFSHVLVLMCDQPALELAHLQALLEGARHAASGCAATQLQGRPSVPAVVPGPWFNDLPQGAAEAGFRARLRALPADALFLLPAAELELDIDTPDDLAEARSRGLVDP